MTNFFDIERLGHDSEAFDTLFENQAVKIERIITRGQVSPEGFYYDQDDDEWVIVLEGSASISYATGENITLNKGDSLFLPAHKKHRVSEVSPLTLWLTVFIK